MSFEPRKHQQEFIEVCRAIRADFERKHTVVCSVTPGGGKSLLPLLAARELCCPLGMRLLWVVPRSSLRSQGESGFYGSFAETLVPSGIARAVSNSDGAVGKSPEERVFITTYQAIVADPTLYANAFGGGEWILFLDESHHVASPDGGSDPAWHNALEPLVDQAKVVVHASGTLERGDQKPIAFLPYAEDEGALVVDLESAPGLHVIQYSRGDALAEDAIVPLYFEALDGHAAWIDTTGERYNIKSLTEAVDKQAGQALQTVLKSEFANELMDRCIEHWSLHRKVYPQAKLLAVAPDIKHAKKYLDHIDGRGWRIAIATSEDSTAAHKEINRLKAGELDILMTVGMAYEGLDVPSVTHVACLTRIRTAPWIEQCVCRANRKAPGKQYGVIFCPNDNMMAGVIDHIRAEQMGVAFEGEAAEPREPKENFLRPPRPDIQILGSGVTGTEAFQLTEAPKALSVREKDLRREVESAARGLAAKAGAKPVAINAYIRRKFGKGRSKMNENELGRVLEFIGSWENSL